MFFFYLLAFFLFHLPLEDVLLWMNVFQNKPCITVVHLTRRLECPGVKWDTPNQSEYARCLRSDSGMHMACTKLMVSGCLCSSRTFSQHPEIPFVSRRLDGTVVLKSCYLCSWHRAIESQGSAVCSSFFIFLFFFLDKRIYSPSNTWLLGLKYVMFYIRNV